MMKARVAYLLAPVWLVLLLGILYGFATWQQKVMPACMLRELTGWQCPGCGGTRTARAILSGQLDQALLLNPLLTILFAAAVLWSLWLSVVHGMLAKPRAHKPLAGAVPSWSLNGKILGLTLAIVVLFALARNFI